MSQLTKDKIRVSEFGDENEIPVAAASIIYEGSAVGLNSAGYARQLVAGDRFAGFAARRADNTGGANGAIRVEVSESGSTELAVAGVTLATVGRPVWASDGNAFNVDGVGTMIGRVCRYVSSGVALVDYSSDDKEDVTVVALPIKLAKVAAGDVLTAYTPGFYGRVIGMDFVVTDPVTTAAKAATLSGKINDVAVTGGAVALTSANCTPLGKVVAGSAITAGADFSNTDTLSIVASAVTAFAEGEGVLYIKLGQ